MLEPSRNAPTLALGASDGVIKGTEIPSRLCDETAPAGKLLARWYFEKLRQLSAAGATKATHDSTIKTDCQ